MSAPPKRIDPKALRGRAKYFFTSPLYHRREVHEFSQRLQRIGETVVIGGVLRDLCLGGVRNFRSDVDFVVKADSESEFERFVAKWGAKRNRFGGYGMRLGRWNVDAWPLERTWAAVSGHQSVRELDDLLKVTFFDWDAIIFSLHDHRIVAREGYFDQLRNRTLDINLAPNPNPLGNAVRGLRYARRWNAKVGPALAAHIAEQISRHGWSEFLEAERKSFSNPMLEGGDVVQVTRALKSPERPIQIFEQHQKELPLD